MTYKIHTLANGLRVITSPVKGTQTATVLIMVATGSKFENRENSGISHFLEHMFFKGTKKRPRAIDIANAFDSLGSENNAFTTKEYTGYWVKVNIQKLDAAVEILSDLIKNSKYEAQEIEREKGVIIEELNMYVDNPIMHIDDVFEEGLYGDTPAGWQIIGTKKTIAGLRREDFLKYVSSQYGAENMIVSVAGNINEKEIIKLAEKHFSGIGKARPEDKAAVVEAQAAPQAKISFKKTDQAHLMLGVRAFPYGERNEFALRVLAIILGGSMGSRLFTELREKRGLAYYVRAQSEFYTDSGYFAASAGVQVEKIEESIEIILREFKKLARELVGPVELKRIKDLIRGRMSLQFESSDSIASWYGRQAIMALEKAKLEKTAPDLKKEILIPEDFFKKIDQVSPKDIRELAGRIFDNSRLNLAIIGPYKTQEKMFAKLLRF
ncbi:MAG: pitrilysin family protein [Patescibacteria group bacterium]|jgi:predicted Zn-dependent peptidase